MLRCLTAGESHGKGIVAVIDGMPAGLRITESDINRELRRRQLGFGRGKRMRIENDRVQIMCGLKGGRTIGSPVSLLIKNKDFRIDRLHKVLKARPGHADLAGYLKYGFSDIREVLERASARSTVATVAVGAVCRSLLSEMQIAFTSRVVSVAGQSSSAGIRQEISRAIRDGDTVGGIFEVRAQKVPVGLGSYTQHDQRLDARLALQVMSIPGIKAVEIGLGFGYAQKRGSEVHDPISYSKSRGYERATNNAGGIEGGISNGEEIVLRACMKPISTLSDPLDSVHVITKKKAKAAVERSDTCVVQAAGVVAEGACAFVIAQAFLEKFGGDNLADIKQSYRQYVQRLKNS